MSDNYLKDNLLSLCWEKRGELHNKGGLFLSYKSPKPPKKHAQLYLGLTQIPPYRTSKHKKKLSCPLKPTKQQTTKAPPNPADKPKAINITATVVTCMWVDKVSLPCRAGLEIKPSIFMWVMACLKSVMNLAVQPASYFMRIVFSWQDFPPTARVAQFWLLLLAYSFTQGVQNECHSLSCRCCSSVLPSYDLINNIF